MKAMTLFGRLRANRGQISANVYPADESLVNIGTASVLTEGAANNNSMRVGGVLTFHSPYVFSIATAARWVKGWRFIPANPGSSNFVGGF